MKYLAPFAFVLCLFLHTAHIHAETFTDPSFKIDTTCEQLSCDITVQWLSTTASSSAPLSLWSTKNGNALSNKVYQSSAGFLSFSPYTQSNPSGTKKQFSVPGLKAGSTYYISYQGKTFSFQTKKISQYTLYVKQNGKNVLAAVSRPQNDTTVLFINIAQNGQSKIQIPLNNLQLATQTTDLTVTTLIQNAQFNGTTVYTQNLGDLITSLASGAYTATLQKNNTIGQTENLYGPASFTLAPSTLTYQWPLTYSTNETTATISGKIDTTAHPDFKNITISFSYSKDKTFPTDSTTPVTAQKNDTDGSYTLALKNLTPSTNYFITQTLTAPNGATETKTDSFNSTKGYIPEGSKAYQDDFDRRSYRLLAPWPGLAVMLDPDLCVEKNLTSKNGQICDLNDFLNFALRIMIGITAVILVFKLMYHGYEYIVTDITGKKATAKAGIITTCGGLLLAMSSYVILNTINPTLVSNDIVLDAVGSGGIGNIIISGGASFDGKPIVIKFDVKMYNDAKFASDKTGVQVALILGLYHQETGGGQNSGGCKPNDSKAKMTQKDKNALERIIISLNKDYPEKGISMQTVNVSCAGATGYGGAIGFTQFLPSTWEEYDVQAKQYLGKYPFPWEQKDALMMTAMFLKKYGGDSSDESKQGYAAGKYYGSQTQIVGCGIKGVQNTYPGCVLMKKKGYEQQIADLKAKGEIK